VRNAPELVHGVATVVRRGGGAGQAASGSRVIRLRAGEDLLVRPITAEDTAELVAGYRRLSAGSRYQRFFTAAPKLRAPEVAYLTQLDHHDHEALVAIVPATGDIVGVARFFRSATDPACAEIALTVADSWQGRGLGGELLRQLVERAREEKITRFTADLLTGNRAMLALIRRLGVVDTTVDGATMTATVTGEPSAHEDGTWSGAVPW
jgi:RimJ/RimL family protein N-acetyltransferase